MMLRSAMMQHCNATPHHHHHHYHHSVLGSPIFAAHPKQQPPLLSLTTSLRLFTTNSYTATAKVFDMLASAARKGKATAAKKRDAFQRRFGRQVDEDMWAAQVKIVADLVAWRDANAPGRAAAEEQPQITRTRHTHSLRKPTLAHPHKQDTRHCCMHVSGHSHKLKHLRRQRRVWRQPVVQCAIGWKQCRRCWRWCRRRRGSRSRHCKPRC